MATATVLPCAPCQRLADRQLDLRAYAFVDSGSIRRFGDLDGDGRKRINHRRWESGKQLGLVAPTRLSLAGALEWDLPHGALDGTVIFDTYVPEHWPEG